MSKNDCSSYFQKNNRKYISKFLWLRLEMVIVNKLFIGSLTSNMKMLILINNNNRKVQRDKLKKRETRERKF